MVPAFGFGVGDFVAVASLLWKISQALSETSEDTKLYREFQLELSAFQGGGCSVSTSDAKWTNSF